MIAETFKNYVESDYRYTTENFYSLMQAMSDSFSENNSRFDRDKFMTACGFDNITS